MSNRNWKYLALAAALTAALGLVSGTASAATSTWSGTVDGSWANPANWDVAPAAGSDLVFTGSGAVNLAQTNDASADGFNSITFNNNFSSPLSITGNQLTLTGAGTALAPALNNQNTTPGASVAVNVSRLYLAPTSGSSVYVGGAGDMTLTSALAGSNVSVHKVGAGNMTLAYTWGLIKTNTAAFYIDQGTVTAENTAIGRFQKPPGPAWDNNVFGTDASGLPLTVYVANGAALNIGQTLVGGYNVAFANGATLSGTGASWLDSAGGTRNPGTQDSVFNYWTVDSTAGGGNMTISAPVAGQLFTIVRPTGGAAGGAITIGGHGTVQLATVTANADTGLASDWLVQDGATLQVAKQWALGSATSTLTQKLRLQPGSTLIGSVAAPKGLDTFIEGNSSVNPITLNTTVATDFTNGSVGSLIIGDRYTNHSPQKIVSNGAQAFTFRGAVLYAPTEFDVEGAGALTFGTNGFDGTYLGGGVADDYTATKTGPGTLALGTSASFVGRIVVQAGKLQMNSSDSLGGVGNGTTILADTTIWRGATLALNGISVIGVTGPVYETVHFGGTSDLAGGPAGSRPTLSNVANGTSTWNAPTTLEDPINFVSGANTNSVLVINGSLTGAVGQDVYVSGGKIVTLAKDNTNLLGKIDVSGAGTTLRVTNANAMGATGSAANGTTVNAGTTLDLMGTASLAAETVTLDGGSLASTGAVTFAGPIVVTANGGNISGSAATTYSGGITATGMVSKTAGTGALTISGGAFSMGTGFSQVVAGATTITSAVYLNNAAQAIDTTGAAVTISGNVSAAAGVAGGTGTITKTGANLLTLSGTNDQAATIVNAGSVVFGSAASAGAAHSVLANTGTIVGYTGTTKLTQALIDKMDPASTGVISLNATTAATDVLDFSNAGTTRLGTSTAATLTAFTGAGTIKANTTDNTLYLGGGGTNLTVAAVITPAMATNVNIGLGGTASGTVIMTGVGTYTGSTTIVNKGVLQYNAVGGTGSLAAASINVNAGGEVVLNYASPTQAVLDKFNSASAGVIALNNATNSTALNLSNLPNTFLGSTAAGVVVSGQLTFPADMKLGGGGSTLTYSKDLAATGNLYIGFANTYGNGTVVLNGANNQAVTGTTYINNGTLTLSRTGGTSVLNGAVIVGSGTGNVAAGLTVTTAGQLDAASSITVRGNGTLTYTFANTLPGLTMTGNANGVATLTTTGVVTTLTGNVSATSSSTGTLGNTVIGGTGSLGLSGTAAGQTRTFTVNNGGMTGTLADLSVTTIVADGSSNAASLTKEGTGTMSLSGANTFTKAVYVNNGTLVAGNVAALGTTAADTYVASGATLDAGNLTGLGSEVLHLNGMGYGSNGAFAATSSGATASTFTNNLFLDGNTKVSGLGGTGAMTLSGTIQDGSVAGAGLTINGSTRKIIVPGVANPYTGKTTIRGNVQIGMLTDAGVASSLGTPAAITDAATLENATIDIGGVLDFVTNYDASSAYHSNRPFRLIGASQLNNNTTGTVYTVLSGDISGAYGLTVQNNSDETLSGKISGVTSLVKYGTAAVGTGTLHITNPANDFNGPTTITSGILEVSKIGDKGVAGNLGIGSTTANATITLNPAATSATLRYIGPGESTNRPISFLVAATNSIKKIDGSGLPTYDPGTGLTSDGMLHLTAGISLGSACDNAYRMELTGDTGGFIGALSTGGAISKTGVGMWTLDGTGSMNFPYGVTISGGTLALGRDNALGTSQSFPVTVYNGTTLALIGGYSSINNSFTDISGVGDSLKGHIGAIENISGNNTLNAGQGVRLNLASTIASKAGTLTIAAGKIDTQGNALTFAGTGNINALGIIGVGSVTQSADGGTTNVTGTSSYTGTTTVNGGSLTVNGTLPGSVTVNNGSFTLASGAIGSATAAVTVNNGSAAFTGNVVGDAILAAGTMSVTGNVGSATNVASVFSGTMTVNGSIASPATVWGGKLVANGGANTVTVKNGGTLAGAAAVAGALAAEVGSKVAPGAVSGAASTGTMSAASATVAGNYEWQIKNATGVAGTDSDLLSVSGVLDATGMTISAKSLTTAGDVGDLNFVAHNMSAYKWQIATAASITGVANGIAPVVGSTATLGGLTLDTTGLTGIGSSTRGRLQLQKTDTEIDLVYAIKGDMNGDGLFNGFDINAFVMNLTNPGTYHTTYPMVDGNWSGDLNNDGLFNGFDINPFVAALVAGGDAPAAGVVVPEPVTMALLSLGGLGMLLRRRQR